MKKIIMLSMIAAIVTGELNAQATRGGAGFLKIGYANLHGSAAVFNKIAPQGISGFNNDFVTVGAEGHYRTGKIILALDANIGAQNSKLVGTKGAEAFSGAGYAKFGWIISENKNYWIYPSIGTGTAAIGMTTYDKVNGKTRNRENSYLLNASFDFGLNADFIIAKTNREKKYNAMLLGLRTGYRASFKNDNWRDGEGYKISSTPSYGYHGFYVTATIGGGRFVTK